MPDEIHRYDEPSPSGRPRTGAAAVLEVILVVLSAVYLLNFTADGIDRMRAPYFENDDRWQGVQIIAAARVLEGKHLFGDYDSEGAYYCYTPLVPLFQAAAFRFFGPSIPSAKATAFVACLAALLAVAVAARALTRSSVAAFVAAGIFAATYRFTDYWHFNIRPDVFATAFSAWGLVFATRQLKGGTRRPDAMIAGVLFALAALSKQNFALLCLVYTSFVAVRSGIKTAALAALPALVVIGAVFSWFDTGGEDMARSLFLMLKQPLKPGYVPADFVTSDLRMIAVPLALAAAAPFAYRSRPGAAGQNGLWTTMCLAGFVVGLLPFVKEGGCTNAFLFFCATVAVMSAVAVWNSAGQRPGCARGVAPAWLVVPAVFLAIEAVASFSFYAEKPIEPYLQPASRFIEKHRDDRIYFPRRNYVTYLASGQYYGDDNMTWHSSLAGLAEPKVVVDMLQGRYFDYIIGDFHSGRLNMIRDANYRRLDSEQLDEFSVYGRREENSPDGPGEP